MLLQARTYFQKQRRGFERFLSIRYSYFILMRILNGLRRARGSSYQEVKPSNSNPAPFSSVDPN